MVELREMNVGSSVELLVREAEQAVTKMGGMVYHLVAISASCLSGPFAEQ